MVRCDAVVVGAGPNGLAAAIELARAGMSVLVLEAAGVVGGGTRTVQLTLPGFLHDVCSAAHPFAVTSPFFRDLPLEEHGLTWIHPGVPLAHPFDDGSAAVLDRTIPGTTATLDPVDRAAYARLVAPLVSSWGELAGSVLRPLLDSPRHPILTARFAVRALRSAESLVERRFRGARAKALLAGIAAHAMMPLDRVPTAAFALLLTAAGHAVGWPFPRGGSQRLADALASYFRSIGGRIRTGVYVRDIGELPAAAAVLLDLTPRQVLRIAGTRLPDGYRRALTRYRYGPGAFKVDWALGGPIPWTAAACREAGTVHLGATYAEMAASGRAAWNGSLPEVPFVLVTQPSLFDSTRAPPGRHTAWAYCHVPHGSTGDMTAAIEAQIERFAPGFRERILARSVLGPAALERRNENLVGGDINGGVLDMRQLVFRPAVRLDPYATPAPGLFICSASTPPGGGVHGLCGYFAARSVLRRLGGSHSA